MTTANDIEPLDPNFQLKLPAFEGPLDLLLHLIQKHELEILELPVAFVTEKYLEYLRVFETLNLDIAAEYLVMAATLTYIKSKMLLPPDPHEVEEDENAEELDPRQELIRRLLEYQKYKEAGASLTSREVAGRDVFPRGADAPEASGPAPLATFSLFRLLDAFSDVVKRNKGELPFEITTEGVSIQERMTQLTDRLRSKTRCSFHELFDDIASVYEIVVTFLAILEMAKRRLALIYQAAPDTEIYLEYKVLDIEDGDLLADVESSYSYQAPVRKTNVIDSEPAEVAADTDHVEEEPENGVDQSAAEPKSPHEMN